MKYIHYGCDAYDPARFEPIKNRPDIPKPSGGLWASREGAEYGWYQWAKDTRMFKSSLTSSFTFSLSETARILVIESVSQLADLPKNDNNVFSELAAMDCRPSFTLWAFLDFEKLSETYDAIEVFVSSSEKLRRTLDSWDCDSLLVMNPDVIEPD